MCIDHNRRLGCLLSVVLQCCILSRARSLPTCPSRAPLVKVRRDDGATTDIDSAILNYALTLEHLEAAFYRTALDTYDAAAFEAAGLPWWVRYRLTEIANHERNHVELLSGALTAAGANATAACTYEFGLTGPASVLATA